MFFPTRNQVQVAVERIGGPTKAAHLTGVSNTTIHAWIKAQRVANIDAAKLMAKLASMDVQQLRSTL